MIIRTGIRHWNEIRTALAAMLETALLPGSTDASIFIKPNFNNDLNALTGNSTDLRVLKGLCGELKSRGFRDITVGDGPNTGTFLTGIDVLERLGVRRLCRQIGVKCRDLNFDESEFRPACGNIKTGIAKTVLSSDYIINLAKIKTHVDAGFSGCVKNWMGINVGTGKWELHCDLFNNLNRNVKIRPPDLCIADGIVGMDGPGPGDGRPVALGLLAMGPNAYELDVAVMRAVGLRPEDIPYFLGFLGSHVQNTDADIRPSLLFQYEPAPRRSFLARTAASPWLEWPRVLLRKVTNIPAVMQIFYRVGIVQDVYDSHEAEGCVYVDADADSSFMNDWCPGNWPRIAENSGRTAWGLDVFSSEHCCRCYYCYWADLKGRVTADIHSRWLRRHLERYGDRVKSMIREIEK